MLVKMHIGVKGKKRVAIAVNSDDSSNHEKSSAGDGCDTRRRSSKLGV